MSTVDLRQYAPHLVARPNRPDPAPRIRCTPVELSDDLPPVDILTARERKRLYEASLHSPALYRFTYELHEEVHA